MSLENDDQFSLDEAPNTLHESQKQSKISYTREFLLSLSELDICKKLPRGFDHSILSEFEDASHDRQRVPGSLLQGYRRTDYSSSPPTRGDSGNYSRGTYGRWESRASARSDKDSDSQSDWDSESGRRYGNQTRRSWQSTEHDGLLGSGSFARPSGYSAGTSAPNAQADEQHQLKKSNEPYHPPRPYKALPHARRATFESLDDETFGSTEVTSQDRAEEEKKRRAAFELMRKEQHKVLQEKQKLNTGKPRDDVFSDLSAPVEQNKEEKKPLERTNEPDGSQTVNGSGTSFSSQPPARRPVVPPGFASTILEKNPKSAVHSHEKEIGKPDVHEIHLEAKANPLRNGISIKQEEERSVLDDNIIHSAFLNKSEKIMKSSYGFEVSKKNLGLDENILLEGQESLVNGEIVELKSKKMKGDEIVSNSNPNQDKSTSILDKLFGSALTVNTRVPFGFIEHRESKPDATWSPNTVQQSSKFAHWFLEEEKKPADDLSSSSPSDLLSLIVGGEKGGGPHSTNPKTTHQNLPEFTVSATSGTPDHFIDSNKHEVVPSVLTCEDLEQAILSEYSEKSEITDLPLQNSHVSSAEEALDPKPRVDNQASQHLLSLLQMGPSPSTNLDVGSSGKQGNIANVLDKPRETNEKEVNDAGKSITLETLFGTAFMKELQSVEAPVSVHRVPLVEENLFSTSIDEVGSNRGNQENNILSSNPKDQPKFDKIENWLRFDDPHIEVDQSKYPAGGGIDGPVEIQLPEEESLITVNSMFGNSSAPINIEEKLAALNAGFNAARGPYDLMAPERMGPHNMHAHSSSPHGRPLFRPLDSNHPAHINHQMKFLGQDSIGQRNSPPNNQFMMQRPPFQHPNAVGPTRFDLPQGPHQMLHHQMQIQGNFPPPQHLLHEFSRGGGPIHHPHLSNNAAGGGFMQEPNAMQGFPPFANRQTNLGMPLSDGGDASGSNHPEALQRLIGMDVRAKQQQQQIHPPPPYGQGMYGHELDMGFRYR